MRASKFSETVTSPYFSPYGLTCPISLLRMSIGELCAFAELAQNLEQLRLRLGGRIGLNQPFLALRKLRRHPL